MMVIYYSVYQSIEMMLHIGNYNSYTTELIIIMLGYYLRNCDGDSDGYLS